MSKIYVFENFNNYANKTSLMYQTINLYPKAAYQATINFSPNDGEKTSLVLMYKDNVLAAPIDLKPDYAIVCDNSDKIESRWYVTDSSRLSDSKFRITLKRDIASDYKSEIMNSVAFVKRGWVNSSNPLIFNSENGNYSQILRERVDLKDKSGKGGYVAFLAPNFISELSKTPEKLDVGLSSDKLNPEIVFGTASQGEEGKYKYCWGMSEGSPQKNVVVRCNTNFGLPVEDLVEANNYISFSIGPASDAIKYVKETINFQIYSDGNVHAERIAEGIPKDRPTFRYDGMNGSTQPVPETLPQSMLYVLAESINTEFRSLWTGFDIDDFIYSEVPNSGDVNSMLFLPPRLGKIARADVVKYFNLTYRNITTKPTANITDAKGEFKTKIEELVYKASTHKTISPSGELPLNVPVLVPYTGFTGPQEKSRIRYSYYLGTFEWKRLTTSVLKLPDTANLINDSPYYIMCIPEQGTKMKCGDNEWTQNINAYQIYTQLQIDFNNFVYDVQQVPYLPLVSEYYENDVLNLPDIKQVGLAKAGEKIEAGVYFCGSDKFWFDLDINNETLKGLASLSDTATKVQSETTLLRLCSMDGSSSININGAKNLGLSKLRVNCRYAPYQSYISLQPQWSMFYGAEIGLKDTRGLNIVSSNTVTRTSEAWRDYILQNQNYQAIFDRQIQSMDTQFDIQAGKAVRDMVFGVVDTVISATASKKGSDAALTSVRGLMNLQQQAFAYDDMVSSYKDKKGLSVDMFNLQNGNIKARADTLSKVNAMSPIYNTWPYIEIYTTTPEEKTALTTYITEFSMNIGAMTSQLSAYVTNNPNTRKFIQADIIRMSGKMDAHLAEEIRSLISEGVYYIETGGTTNESGTSAVNTEND